MNKFWVTLVVSMIIIVGFSMLFAYILSKPSDGITFGDRVAVIDVHGPIVMQKSDGLFTTGGVTPKEFKEKLKKAENDASIKAVVLDINSPGGSVVASEEMAESIRLFQEDTDKPVIAWLGEIAASGGYYVAAPCDYIVADRGTITGSIGVISIFPEYSRLMEKLGINMTIITAGKYKAFSSGYRPMEPEEREMMEDLILDVYDMFIQEVSSGRDLDKEYVKTVAEGKIYGGTRAVEVGLADEIGTRRDAILKAGEMGGIKGEPQVFRFTKTSFLDELVGVSAYNFGHGLADGLVRSQGDYIIR